MTRSTTASDRSCRPGEVSVEQVARHVGRLGDLVEGVLVKAVISDPLEGDLDQLFAPFLAGEPAGRALGTWRHATEHSHYLQIVVITLRSVDRL